MKVQDAKKNKINKIEEIDFLKIKYIVLDDILYMNKNLSNKTKEQIKNHLQN